MGFYEEQILPRGIDWVMRGEEFSKLRKKYLSDVAGDVLEVGFGSGLNLPHYPDEVSRLWALDPASLGRKLASDRLSKVSFPIEFIDLIDNRIALEDEVADAVVTTWTLCTIPDVVLALSEIKRVLKPGGQYFFLEHGLSPDKSVARWQNLWNPMQKFIAGGCHVNRAIDQLITSSGLSISQMDNFYFPEGPKVMGYLYAGKASLI